MTREGLLIGSLDIFRPTGDRRFIPTHSDIQYGLAEISIVNLYYYTPTHNAISLERECSSAYTPTTTICDSVESPDFGRENRSEICGRFTGWNQGPLGRLCHDQA